MGDTSTPFLSITDVGARFRDGSLSPVSLTEQMLARIDSMDPTLGAYRLVCRNRALAQAHAAERAFATGSELGPLHGIPYAAKDLYDIRGLPTTAGTRVRADHVAETDSRVVATLAAAGMVLLGKTNTVQFAYGGAGINHDHGTPHNPWHETAHLPGGSSSGSGVAVAAGMATMALGSDTGGSVRIPAALCGVTGLKTTVGRISRAGVYPLSWSLDSVGPLTRTVADAALVYQALQGPDSADDTTLNRPAQDVLGGLNRGVRGLRIAFAESAFWEGVEEDVERAVRECGAVFTELGAHVSSVEFPQAAAASALNPRGLVIAAEAYAANREYIENHFDALDPIVAFRLIKGKEVLAHEYLQTTLDWKRLRAEAVDAMADIDALLCPATMIPALPVAEVDADKEVYAEANLNYLRNTAIGNILDLCGLSVPCGFTRKGLPIGLMIYGKPFDEGMVLRIGQAFQQATDWHGATPNLDWIRS